MEQQTMYSPEEFNLLPREKKAVIVAKDVILRLNLDQFVADSGYSNFLGVGADYGGIKEGILRGDIKCEGCARGAMFYSSIVFKNKLKMRDLHASTFRYSKVGPDSEYFSVTDFMEDIFSREQQSLIECAYERSVSHGEEYAEYELRRKAAMFTYKGTDGWLTPDEKLRKIMNNVIENNGTFVP